MANNCTGAARLIGPLRYQNTIFMPDCSLLGTPELLICAKLGLHTWPLGLSKYGVLVALNGWARTRARAPRYGKICIPTGRK
jgi:hypothetical protein